jgi:hypothetical protein
MSIVKANTYQDATGGSNAVFSGVASPPNSMGFRNRIINGNMAIDQRNGGASVTPTDGAYTLDRWAAYLTQASKFTVQRNAGSVTPPAGFSYYLGVTSSSAYSVLTSDIFAFGQPIEGFNAADLAWGTANAQTITLSFWVRSSLTGTFGGTLTNSAQNRFYVFSYSISSANTWEQKTITIVGDTSGTWTTDNTAGIRVRWGLGVGSSNSGTAGSWGGTSYWSATGATSVVGTNGATFYITGVQLEAGTNASAFEQIDYGRELMMCQRYYQTAGAAACGGVDGSTTVTVQIAEKTFVPMRAAPSGAIYSGVSAAFRSQGADFTAASPSLANFTCNGNNSFWTQVNGFTGLTANAVVTGRSSQSTNNGNFIALSAEL